MAVPKAALSCRDVEGMRANGTHVPNGTHAPNGTHLPNGAHAPNGAHTPNGTHMPNGIHISHHDISHDGARDSDQAVLLFSAYSAASLASEIEAFKDFATSSDATVTDLAYTLANRREQKPFRSYAVAADKASFEVSATMSPQTSQPRIAWVFTGQGAQWPNMGRDLIDADATFCATIQKLDRFLLTLPTPPPWTIEGGPNIVNLTWKWALLTSFAGELRKNSAQSRVHQAEFGHPMSIAVQVALVDVLRSWGVLPDLVLGHSSGEMAAAYGSGAITAESAIAVATFRSLNNNSSNKEGSMAAIGLGRHEVSSYLLPGVVIACENSQSSVTLSGDKPAVEEITRRIKTERPEVLARALRVEKAFHSRESLFAVHQATDRPLTGDPQLTCTSSEHHMKIT